MSPLPDWSHRLAGVPSPPIPASVACAASSAIFSFFEAAALVNATISSSVGPGTIQSSGGVPTCPSGHVAAGGGVVPPLPPVIMSPLELLLPPPPHPAISRKSEATRTSTNLSVDFITISLPFILKNLELALALLLFAITINIGSKLPGLVPVMWRSSHTPRPIRCGACAWPTA